MCSTFHSFAYGLIRRYSPPELYAGPLRLLSAPEQDVVLRELLDRRTRSRCRWPDVAAPGGSAPAASPTRCTRCSAGPGRRASTADALRALGRGARPAGVRRRRAVPRAVPPRTSTQQSATDYADLIRRAVIEAAAPPRRAARAVPARVRRRVPGHRPGPGARCSGSSPATARDLTVVGDPHQSIYAFRGAEVRGILDFPDEFPRRDGRAGRRASRCGRRAGSARAC